ncbi:DEAD/DEAH box helicase family protein [Geomonas nitrogeniifigens]|uniref:SNF2-related protein n=1 Tax=Geomonas diazotrophica TaxID=2843197 RepID=UPI001C2BDE1E|nr:SNF2-related protein [Geomonas nitrogeniifigens]QXE87398.1 DEAD/DEAH box helicase family protein [Geomonas nitrogeniifigens]
MTIKSDVDALLGDWDPQVPAQNVRVKDNPGKKGATTGVVKKVGTRVLVQVRFSDNETIYKPYETLELEAEPGDLIDILKSGSFGSEADLQRLLTFEKVQGTLTNIFYSMESSSTDFYPHQFKPVIRFLESPVGRLLIADEVGLGKTIEAFYIWKELQTRIDARRLLVVCPSMLLEKWRTDIKLRFNQVVTVIRSSKDFLDLLRSHADLGPSNAFSCVVSLESIRCLNDWHDEKNRDPRSEIARILDRHGNSEDPSLFDLVIIDEAHYLRNPETASNKIARLLADASRHLVLLTATPIQLNNNNLYQLLRLISPEEFYSDAIFEGMLRENAPVVKALRLLWQHSPNIPGAKAEVGKALTASYFKSNQALWQVYKELDAEHVSDEQRVKLGQLLDGSSLLTQYMTRSRKRDVFVNRVERKAKTLQVHFTEMEKQLYRQITARIRATAQGLKGLPLFSLISRQRQMASCMPAAIEAWRESGLLEDLLWEDLGVSPSLNEYDIGDGDGLGCEGFGIEDIDLEQLKMNDSKYVELVEFLKAELLKNSQEKFVLFAYFRGTLGYLQDRLRDDGITADVVMGGMGDQKDEILERFKTDNRLNVLLTSEVSSEGIDLQFCRYIINYDLPWNPMRVEQRIGRLDRLGQQAEKIFIINFSLVDTIEEQILERLYERIKIFEESIGDLEQILGEVSGKLLEDFFKHNLTDEERKQKAKEAAVTILKTKSEQEKLESEAINLMAFSDFIVDNISKSREQGRWLQPEEVASFVDDFFKQHYLGSVMHPKDEKNTVFEITLTDKAKTDLDHFISRHSCPTRTTLTRGSAVPCFFDARQAANVKRNYELIDTSHPLIRFIRHSYQTSNKQFQPVVAVKLSRSDAPAGMKKGTFVFLTHLWSFSGMRTHRRLVHKVCDVNTGKILSDSSSEAIVLSASRQGRQLFNARNLLDMIKISDAADLVEQEILERFVQESEEFDADNTNKCDVQERSARAHYDRRTSSIRGTLSNVRTTNPRVLKMWDGQLNKAKRDLDVKLKDLGEKRATDPGFKPIAAGIVVIEA